MFDNQMCVKIGDFGEAKPYQSFLEKMVALQEQVEDNQGVDFVNIGNAYDQNQQDDDDFEQDEDELFSGLAGDDDDEEEENK